MLKEEEINLHIYLQIQQETCFASVRNIDESMIQDSIQQCVKKYTMKRVGEEHFH